MDLQHAMIDALRHTDRSLVTRYIRTGTSSGVVTYSARGIHITTASNDWHVYRMNIQGPSYSITLHKDQPLVCEGASVDIMRCYLHEVLKYPVTTNVHSYLLLHSLYSM